MSKCCFPQWRMNAERLHLLRTRSMLCRMSCECLTQCLLDTERTKHDAVLYEKEWNMLVLFATELLSDWLLWGEFRCFVHKRDRSITLKFSKTACHSLRSSFSSSILCCSNWLDLIRRRAMQKHAVVNLCCCCVVAAAAQHTRGKAKQQCST